MFPLRDDNPTELFPVVTLGIMAACALVWWLVQGVGASSEVLGASICALGTIPAEVTGGAGSSGPCRMGGWTRLTLVSSMFLHGGWAHLIGNLWFLWIFGNNVEDSMGHGRFVVFYLLTGLIAVGAHIATDPNSTIPLVGASGAISGVMGGYLVLYPKARIHTFFWFLIFFRVIPLPAWVMLGYWMVLQLSGTLATSAVGGGGVAYGAHIGGFVAGVVLIGLFRSPRLVEAKRRGVVLSREEIPGRGWW